MRVLKFKHVAPWEGCNWRFEYLGISGNRAEPIVWTAGYAEPQELYEAWLSARNAKERLLHPETRLLNRFKEFQLHQWNNELFQHVPANWWPTFWWFGQNHDLEFPWPCEWCGEIQANKEPAHPGSMRCLGGAQYEPDGWLCNECYSKSEVN